MHIYIYLLCGTAISYFFSYMVSFDDLLEINTFFLDPMFSFDNNLRGSINNSVQRATKLIRRSCTLIRSVTHNKVLFCNSIEY